ncbi:hypothetical protein T03_16026 [Trichinella britovi]|uniref:Secreted protein n=1 Tax=Trichinella britovi TaxID=45882 RepID=A0A0V1C826_TRIBR|nr:hypothetical protein T03_16026 [Trichinella britovi]
MISRICLCQTLFAFLITSHMLVKAKTVIGSVEIRELSGCEPVERLSVVQLRQTLNRGNKSSPTHQFKDTAGENRGWLLVTDLHDPTSRCVISRRSACCSVIAGH